MSLKHVFSAVGDEGIQQKFFLVLLAQSDDEDCVGAVGIDHAVVLWRESVLFKRMGDWTRTKDLLTKASEFAEVVRHVGFCLDLLDKVDGRCSSVSWISSCLTCS
jgi:hypothetical protein